jgi:outer membrane protein
MIKTKHIIAVSLMTAALSAAQQAYSYEAGEWLVRAGATTVDPDSSSSNAKVNGATVPNSGVTVGQDTALGITGVYMIDSHIGIELLVSTPFKHDIYGSGALNGVKIGSTKHLPPTLSLQYYPMDSKSAVQPYVGIGINHTVFFQEDTDSDMNAFGDGADLELDDSTGASAQIGVDLAINDRWFANAAVWYMDIETDATVKYNNGTEIKVNNVEIDPWVYNVGVGYRF